MKILILLFLLPSLVLNAQEAKEPKEAQSVAKELRVMVAGIRALPVFEKKGEDYIEVDPPKKSIFPTEISLLNGKIEKDPKSPDAKKEPNLSVRPNQILKIIGYKGPALIQLGLRRPFLEGDTDQPISFDVGKMVTPLAIIRADAGGREWDAPLIKVIDLKPEDAPARSAIVVNLTKLPIATRFESVGANSAPDSVNIVRLPKSDTSVYRFRIDTPLEKGGSYPLANSSYKIKANQRLIILVIPDFNVSKGSAPLKLQMVLDE